ncbi:MAG: YCF48-related protein [Candidatus Margulisbacteria bacterium]|nr:YCF48-related protein [Candidatus Margulisiibacteriota bacterium]
MKGKVTGIVFLLAFLLSSGAWAGWVSQESSTTQNLNSLSFVTEFFGFAAGDNGVVLKTLDGGANWAPKVSGTTQNLNDVIFPAAGEGYILGTFGTVRKSTNNGEVFSAFITLPTADATAEFKKGSFAGAIRCLAASKGASADSFLLISYDSGSTWGSAYLTNLNVEGTFTLATGEPWVWGKDFSNNQYQIRRGATVVWTGAGSLVRDLKMVDSNVGYAVGDGGLVLKTTSGGGTSGSWSTVSFPLTNNLKRVFFISQNFGWVVGENGLVAVTSDGGDNWSIYEVEGSPDINSIYVREISSGVVHAYIAGDAGKIFKLASPTITAVTPATKSQGWLGTLEVTGAGFVQNAYVTLVRSGQTSADPDISILYTSVESTTKIVAYLLISPEAIIGARGVKVTNPDATTSTEAAAFSVITAQAEIRDLWVDGTKWAELYDHSPATFTVLTNPSVTYDVYSPSGVTIATVNTHIVLQYNGSTVVIAVPTSALTAVSTQDVRVSYQLASNLPQGKEVQLMFIGEDTLGNVGAENMLAVVTTPETLSNTVPLPGGNTLIGAVYVHPHVFVPETQAAINVQVRLVPGKEVTAFRANLTDWKGSRVWEYIFLPGPTVNRFNFQVPARELPHYMGRGMYVLSVKDNVSGELIGRAKFMIAHSSMVR